MAVATRYGSAASYDEAVQWADRNVTQYYGSGPNSFGASYSVRITDLSEQEGSSSTMVVAWYSSLLWSSIASFEFMWQYLTPSGSWADGGSATLERGAVEDLQYIDGIGMASDGHYAHSFSVSSISSNPQIKQIRARVRPVCGTDFPVSVSYPDGDSTRTYTTTVPWWVCDFTPWVYADNPGLAESERELNAAPGTPPAPSIQVNGDDTVTVSWSGIGSPATHARVTLGVDDGLSDVATVPVSTESWTSAATYTGVRVRARVAAYNSNSRTWSDPSPWSQYEATRPTAPEGLAASAIAGAVRLDWVDTGSVGEGYRVEVSEYAGAWEDGRDDIRQYTPSVPWSGGENHCTLTGLAAGGRYYIRIRAVDGAGESALSNTASVLLGAVPEAPSTQPTSPSVVGGATVRLLWTHNCADNSTQAAAEVKIAVDGAESVIEVGSDGFLAYTAPQTDGARVEWCVRTQGISGDWSPWSAVRAFSVYARPVVSIVPPTVPVASLPAVFGLRLSASVQSAVEWSFEIVAGEDYDGVGADGTPYHVAKGRTVWSSWIAAGDEGFGQRSVSVSCGVGAGLKGGVSYTAVARALTDAGLLSDDASCVFTCDFGTANWVPSLSADIADAWSAVLVPSCYAPGRDISIAVYRVTDGVRLIANGLASGQATTDPHPDLGTCIYRVVATDTATGLSAFRDLECIVPGNSILIDWDGNHLALPYNMKVSEAGEKDALLKHYIGRTHPIGYHGTIVRETGTFQAVVEKRGDRETLRLLRQLKRYRGNAYIREPRGMGCWANVDVSLDASFDSALVSVAVSYERVEGEGA